MPCVCKKNVKEGGGNIHPTWRVKKSIRMIPARMNPAKCLISN